MRISGSPMADVFVDLWGVLADSRRMTPAYRQRAAELLWSRHGGSIEAWLRAHDAAGAWYEAHMASPETWTGGTWVEGGSGRTRARSRPRTGGRSWTAFPRTRRSRSSWTTARNT